ncbi:MAG: RNA-binding transcriptional accessory protein [Granulosicoccus sp.]|nr:RNA-binding transcriptional accessory protein [Granulosicoccus sp.]
MSDTDPLTSKRIIRHIAQTVEAAEHQVSAAIQLLDAGATVPFISRYRKEMTGALTDTQLRLLEERLSYLRELEVRRQSILSAIAEQGKLGDELRSAISKAGTKAELEDLYLPFKKKRRTRGQIAIEAGLLPLADLLWQDASQDPAQAARHYITPADMPGSADVTRPVDVKAALEGARYILMERFAMDASLIARLRDLLWNKGYLCASLVSGKAQEGARYRDYFDHQEPLARIPGHRALAMFRARSEGVLTLGILLKQGDEFSDDSCIDLVGSHLGFQHRHLPADDWKQQVVAWTWKVKLSLHLESELLSTLRSRADAEAISVFAANLQDLLLAAPAGPRATLGLDPGYRSGVKVCVVDATGKVADHATIYPHKPQQQWQQSLDALARLCIRHAVELIAVGNGTASRETEKLADELIVRMKKDDGSGTPAGQSRLLTRVVVSEAGASVYSASQLAEAELPELDVTIRGAVSIARRLQDPLAELVKIDPKAIGVGQYQHDVSQTGLARSLDATVEDCVNAVGVDLGTASAALLSRVAGLTPTLADNIVAYRDEQGTFRSRKELKKVPRLGPKAFEQAAGFLRIRDGRDALDASGVHPEAYPVVQRIVQHCGQSLEQLIGNVSLLRSLEAERFTDERFGLPTVRDILRELEKPGRDPRPDFRAVQFADGVEKIGDLKPNQVLEGKVTNVTVFGAFVDVGVHQDGLVHISALSDAFVKDPRDVVKAGDIVQVKVMSVDLERQRIALSMRMSDEADTAGSRAGQRAPGLGGEPAARRGTEKDRKQGPQRRDRHPNRTSGRVAGSESMNGGVEQPSALALSLKAALDKR